MATKTSTTYTMSTTPSWFSNYAQDVLQNQNAVSSRPFTPYDYTERVAPFNATQRQGFGMVNNAATSYQPTLNTAKSTIEGTLGRSGANAASPYFNAATSTDYLAPVYGALGSATGATMAATDPLGMKMAQPYLTAAGGSSADMAANYMNPYMDSIVKRYGELGARTLQEQLMPAATNKYITLGQLGGPTRPGTGATGAPSGLMTDAARALRDTQENVAKQQADLMYKGWDSASNLAATDLNRYGALANTAANIGKGQQDVLLNAGQNFGNMASTYNTVGSDVANRMANIGTSMGNLYNADTSNALNAGTALGNLASTEQNLGLTGAKAITDIGDKEQNLDQDLRNAKFAEFMRMSGYDQAQIDAMTKTLSGVAPAIPQGSVSTTTNKGASGSTLGNVAGAALTYAGSAGRP